MDRPYFVSMFYQVWMRPRAQRHKNNLHTFLPRKLHGWDEVSVARNRRDSIYNPTTGQPSDVEPDLDIHAFLPDVRPDDTAHGQRKLPIFALRGLP